MDEKTHPRLRHDIQAVPLIIDGRNLVTFIDPLRIAGTGLALDQRALPLVAMLDGTHDLRDIQAVFMRLSGGAIIPISDVEALVAQLDAAFLLESEAFLSRKRELSEDFARSTVREAVLAGSSYEADPALLRSFIALVESTLEPLPGPPHRRVRGLITPHIDIPAAREAYVDAYRRIAGCAYDTVVILGVDHHGSQGLYCITDKDFATPLGTLATDRQAIALLKDGLPEGTLAPDDFNHMMEHSIEFQAVFLAHYLGTGIRIVPVLCGGIHEFLAQGNDPFEDGRFLAFRDALAGICSRGGEKVLVVAGVDFSHVGRKFGHSLGADALIDRARGNDAQIIGHLLAGRSREIYANAAGNSDEFNVCGLSAMMLFSSLMGTCTGQLLHHGTSDEPASLSAVTFASMVFSCD